MELIKRTAASKQIKLKQLISGEELGDRKPTHLLRRMQQLLGGELGTAGDSNSFLPELFLQRLPANVRMVLASADDSTDLHKLADMADKVMEVASPTVAALSGDRPDRTDASEMEQLREKVARLADLVSSLTTRSRRRNSYRPRRPNSPAPSSFPSTDSLCWYHARFGKEAQKCKEPCSWGNSKAGH